MKTFFKTIISWIRNLTVYDFLSLCIWLLKWALIIFAMGLFVYGSMFTGKLIGEKSYIVFLLDLAFCLLLWTFLGLSKYVGYGGSVSRKYIKKAVFMGLFMIVVFVMTAMATLGTSIYTSTLIMLNIYILPIMIFITIGIHFQYCRKTT